MKVPEVRYARSGELNIAYQTVGEGPLDVVFVMGWVSNVELFWQEPTVARFFRRLASFSRLRRAGFRMTALLTGPASDVGACVEGFEGNRTGPRPGGPAS